MKASQNSWASKPSNKQAIQKIMDRAKELNRSCREECRDFRIMSTPLRNNALILRWTTINIDDIDRPVQSYRFECFQIDGTSQLCSVHYSNVEEANTFFHSLTELYRQAFANDPII